ncbi:MAG: hypothetical protein LUG23_00145 [Oscillospiraceae bacterium]|nr:hypothetical protein [Oscillospiraceae bacterium]
MISFVKLGENTGAWANKDKALEYLAAGYQIFSDETCETELTQEDIEAMDETVQGTTVTITAKAKSVVSKSE